MSVFNTVGVRVCPSAVRLLQQSRTKSRVKFTTFTSFNLERAVVDHLRLTFLIPRFFPKIFAINDEVVQNRTKVVHFLPSQFMSTGPQTFVSSLSCHFSPSRHISYEYRPTYYVSYRPFMEPKHRSSSKLTAKSTRFSYAVSASHSKHPVVRLHNKLSSHRKVRSTRHTFSHQ